MPWMTLIGQFGYHFFNFFNFPLPCLVLSSLPNCFAFGLLRKLRLPKPHFCCRLQDVWFEDGQESYLVSPHVGRLKLLFYLPLFIWSLLFVFISAFLWEKYQMWPILQQGQIFVYLVGGGWYLDCHRGFIPEVETPSTAALFALTPR